MKLIVGLGNPGARYSKNRHNVGFMVLDLLAKELGVSVDQKKADALIGQGAYRDQKLLLAKPQTFMNLSGKSVMGLIHFYHDRLDDLVVVHDDMDLPLGRLRFKADGGAGGHNGLKSVTEHLASQEYDRLKIGVGRPADFMKPEVYVLSNFTGEELSPLEQTLRIAAEALKFWSENGCAAAMNHYNGLTAAEGEIKKHGDGVPGAIRETQP
ncbi:MAG: aminoacyl-tRNA hydrolase [Peptococcaceae bacterium]|nr:aminoacyl-tRNA hydrolase [Peptococcaceae bacterium]